VLLIVRRLESAGARRQDGFTLIELIVSLAIGTVIVLASYSLLDLAGVQAVKVTDRVDSAQRGRQALDAITRQLRSQVCLQNGTSAITDGQDSSITFYTFTGAGAYSPELHNISWSASTRSIVEQDYVGTGTPPSMTFPTVPTHATTLLTDVTQAGGAPIFTYYTWPATGQVLPTLKLTAPLSAPDLLKAVRVLVQFKTFPAGHPTAAETTTLQDDAYSRTADPDASGGPALPVCG
jgi:prepilin-type N-terminal cleavage/methylation domain-containing protein